MTTATTTTTAIIAGTPIWDALYALGRAHALEALRECGEIWPCDGPSGIFAALEIRKALRTHGDPRADLRELGEDPEDLDQDIMGAYADGWDSVL